METRATIPREGHPDPACTDLAVCTEDGIDNDEDGLLDCEDGDCWGTRECGSPEAISRIKGGWGIRREHVHSVAFTVSLTTWKTRKYSFNLHSVSGSARVIPSSQTWSTTSTRTTPGVPP